MTIVRIVNDGIYFCPTLSDGQQVKLKTTATTVGDKSLALNYPFKYNTFMSYGCLILFFPIQCSTVKGR